MNKTRLNYIDIAKGIGIILVVLFHTPNIGSLCYVNNFYWGGYITTFYMPLFFILSGLFFNTNSIVKRIKKLSIPYFSFLILGIITYITKCLITQNNIDWYKTYSAFLGNTKDYPNTPCWFLLSLITITILYTLITKLKNKANRIILSIILSIIGYYLGKTHLNIPYYIDVSLLCNIFFVIGFEFRDIILNMKGYKTTITLLILSLLIYYHYPNITNISQNLIPYNILIFYILSISSCFSVIGMSKFLQESKLEFYLAYLGKNSLIILCTHMILIPIGKPCWDMNMLFFNIIGTIIIIIIEIPIIKLVTNKFSCLIGNNIK